MPYPAVNSMLDDAFPRGALNYWKSAFFTELSDAAVQTMIDAFEAAPSIMTGMVIEHFHGAVCRVDPTATAYPFREPGYNLVLTGQWSDPADTDANVAWVRDTFAALEPYTGAEGVRELPGRRRERSGCERVRAQPRSTRRDQAALRPGQPLPAQPQHRPGVGRGATAQEASASAAPSSSSFARAALMMAVRPRGV